MEDKIKLKLFDLKRENNILATIKIGDNEHEKIFLIFIPLFIYGSVYSAYCQESEIDKNDAIENAYRDKIQQPEKVLKVIGVKEGMVIGEPGAGRGYFTLKLAKKVGPSGLIYANDINKDDLQILQMRASELGLTNIQTIVGIEDDPLLPDGKLDMAIMVWVYAALTKPVEFLKNLKKYLKPGGTLVMIVSEPEKTGSKSEVRKRENIFKKHYKGRLPVITGRDISFKGYDLYSGTRTAQSLFISLYIFEIFLMSFSRRFFEFCEK